MAAGCGDDGTPDTGTNGDEIGAEQGDEQDTDAEQGDSQDVTSADDQGEEEDSTAGPDTTSDDQGEEESASEEGMDEGATKFDTLSDVDAGSGNPNCVGGELCDEAEFSYIWIANSSENTVSKINTRTMVEESRFYSRPDQGGSPSRTSVSVDGRAVAIANRQVGITKIWADHDDCVDANTNGMIDTSTGKDDVRPFAEDECIAWHKEFPDMTVQRPVAWTSGTYNEETCVWEDQKIWTATGNGGSPGQCGTTGIWVHRLSGDTGDVEDTIHIPHAEAPCTIGNIEWGLGPYGAAVDNEGNLWFYIWAQGKVVNVNYETLEYQVIQGGSYGITVDSEGRPWDDVPRRLNLDTMQWENVQGGSLPGAGGSGVAQDLQGRIWKSVSGGGVGWVDMETMQVGDTVYLPTTNNHRGIGVDVDGFIWAVPLNGTTAHKIDPDTYEVFTYDGLNAPYTYSDMAGGQLSNVTCNEPQG
ncbi:hypothetical protein PPSIR1_11280 [Plesiocystis pacifica SIR-1]|uniref:Uncharacterized protein n=2 Tax=Plesiocystis pacifica TaxID=191768 RepID=A6G159_9BACT|nr:hypothetical protein PPSIR1_11280 [Plesiocystis pacifica SIR-1]